MPQELAKKRRTKQDQEQLDEPQDQEQDEQGGRRGAGRTAGVPSNFDAAGFVMSSSIGGKVFA